MCGDEWGHEVVHGADGGDEGARRVVQGAGGGDGGVGAGS